MNFEKSNVPNCFKGCYTLYAIDAIDVSRNIKPTVQIGADENAYYVALNDRQRICIALEYVVSHSAGQYSHLASYTCGAKPIAHTLQLIRPYRSKQHLSKILRQKPVFTACEAATKIRN